MRAPKQKNANFETFLGFFAVIMVARNLTKLKNSYDYLRQNIKVPETCGKTLNEIPVFDMFQADVRDLAQLKNATNYAFTKYGKLDVAINNAGLL